MEGRREGENRGKQAKWGGKKKRKLNARKMKRGNKLRVKKTKLEWKWSKNVDERSPELEIFVSNFFSQNSFECTDEALVG